MKKIAFMGAKDIGYKCLIYLNTNAKNLNIEIVAVLTNTRGKNIKEYAHKNNIRLINSLEEYLKINDYDILISVQYHKILKKIHIQKAKEIAVNLHMAPLPEYRGCNQFSYAIINQDKRFGVTIHKLDEGIDSGDIIFEDRFNIPSTCWVEDLLKLSIEKSYKLFINTIPDLINGNYSLKKQSSIKVKKEFHLRCEIDKLKNIDINQDADSIKKYIRATYMPNFEPPYFLLNNKKIYFKKENNE